MRQNSKTALLLFGACAIITVVLKKTAENAFFSDSSQRSIAGDGRDDYIKEKRQFAECKQVYLDVGSNIGVQVRKLFEPQLYPGAPVLALFDAYFGTDRSGRVCAIGIEMNPVHTARLKRLEDHYRTVCGYTVRFLTETAASSQDLNNLTFWTDRTDAENHEWGASLMPRTELTESHAVRTLDLARFILEEIRPFASTVVMKLDIEGAEFDVIPHLLLRGAFCDLDLVFAEVHPWVKQANAQQRAFLDASITLINSGQIRGCKVRVSMLDDETYRHDAVDAASC